MLAVSVALLFFVVSLLVAQFLKWQWIRRQYPPGPTPYPFFGNLLQMNFNIHHEILKKVGIFWQFVNGLVSSFAQQV